MSDEAAAELLRQIFLDAEHRLEPPGPSFTCPRCGRTSHNENDIREGYCGACHDWTRQ